MSESSRSARKSGLRAFSARWAERRNAYLDRSRAFQEENYRYLRFLIPEGLRVLDAGCGTGRLLAALRPRRGVGIDISPEMIEIARADHPQFEFAVGDVED